MSHSDRARTRSSLNFESVEPRRMLAAHIVGSPTVYATIQAAIDAAAPKAVITVDAGTYSEQVYINKTVTVQGAKAGVDARTRSTTGESIIGGIAANGAQTFSFYISADDVTLDGFTVQGETSKDTTRGAGIVIAPNTAGTHILNNIVQNNVAGLFLANDSSTDAALIQHNLFKTNNNAGINGGRGIYTDGDIQGALLTNVTIDANTFTGNRGGSGTTGLESAIAVERQTAGLQTNITITNNTFTANGKSVLFMNTTGILIQGNSASGALDWYSGSLRFEGNNHNVTISYNNIFSNTGPGVAVDSNGVPGDNSGFVVTNNNVYGNGTTSGGKLGVIFNQTVYDGAFDATNNYWGAATGPSGDGPGSGDSVYGNASKANQWSYAKGGIETFSPWATATIDITKIPAAVAPTAPSGLAATATSSTQVVLAWTVTASNATSQLVQRSTDGVNFTTIATVGGSAAGYTDATVTGGTAYTYRVIAANSTGNSAPSNVATAKPPVYQPPVAPSGLTVTKTTASSVSLSWSIPGYTVGLAGYVVYRNGVAVANPLSSAYTDTGLTAGTTYTYTVATKDNTGALSAQTPAVSATTAALPVWSSIGLSGSYNRGGIVTDGTRFTTGGFDGGGYALSSALLGTKLTWNGSTYGIGAAGVNDVVNAAGQTIALPAVNGTTLGLLAAAANGNQANQTFVVRYTDGTTQSVTLSISDWATPQSYAGESIALAMGYRDASTGAKQTTKVDVYGYSLTLDATKTLASVTLPKNANVNVLAMNLYAAAPVAAAAPLNVAASAVSATQIRVAWTATNGAQTSFILQRSTDGTTFTTVSSAIDGAATSYTDTNLSAGTKYSYRIYAVNAVGTSAASAVVSATTLSSSVITTPLSSLAWTSATSGYGTVQKNASVSGNPITLRGTTYASGIGTHASSTIVYKLAGTYTNFLSDVGVDDEVNGKGTGTVDFQVYGDGKLLYDSGALTNQNGIASLNVSVAGVQTLTLVAASVGGNIDFAHADWANARLLSTPAAPAAPSNVTAAGLTTTAVRVGWSATSGATGYKIDRSLDGTTWATVASVGATAATYDDTGLTNGTKYYYRVRATSSYGDSANSAVVSTSPIAATAVATQLSSLNWTSATAGYGSVQKNLNASGDPIVVGGVTYASGVGTHSESTIVYQLAGGYTTFQSLVGFDDRTVGKPSDAVDIQVVADGKVIYDSGAMTSGAQSLSLDITGVQTLSLVVKAVVPGSIDYGHIDWAGAQLLA